MTPTRRTGAEDEIESACSGAPAVPVRLEMVRRLRAAAQDQVCAVLYDDLSKSPPPITSRYCKKMSSSSKTATVDAAPAYASRRSST
jgi:hypothetical protein